MWTILKCSRNDPVVARKPARLVVFLRCWCASLLVFSELAGCARRDALSTYPYLHPLTSPGAKFAGMPPAAQSAVRAEVGAAEMYDIRKLNIPDRDIYEVRFRYPDLYPPLYVAADGSVLYPDLSVAVTANANEIGPVSGGAESGISFSDLPINVAKTIHDKAPTAEVDFINRVMVGSKTFYHVTFKNPAQHSAMLLTEEGVLTNSLPQ